ncbi:uncharacterized protein LOC128551700, partial [Mercenaria mercenaria]|uniref:uncharacterized protein LOC128551700 n=1 Tax=Mercenaria mercenaria TaxID=6596 RepID=UPI00234F1772
MKICDYSSLIFTGNTTVLLILALTTDYWEYRTFDKNKIIEMVNDSTGTQIVLPFDTDSYFQIKILPNLTIATSLSRFSLMKSESHYHAPLFFIRRYFQGPEMNTSEQNFILEELELDLFEQYGNLFRDCDSLEGFFLTIGIALFHGKCHILRKMEFFPGHNIPYKNILHRYKVYTYGWSFVLAWICVFFCYIAAYVWLSKAQ